MEHTGGTGDAQVWRAMAARVLRIVCAFEPGRQMDDFEIQAWAESMATKPHIEMTDYEQAVKRIKTVKSERLHISELLSAAQKEWERRTGARSLSAGNRRGNTMPANFWEMVEQAKRIHGTENAPTGPGAA